EVFIKKMSRKTEKSAKICENLRPKIFVLKSVRWQDAHFKMSRKKVLFNEHHPSLSRSDKNCIPLKWDTKQKG
ncbi:MAG: hypothetical protein ACE5I1_10105, partial [bacterium]